MFLEIQLSENSIETVNVSNLKSLGGNVVSKSGDFFVELKFFDGRSQRLEFDSFELANHAFARFMYAIEETKLEE